MKKSTKRGLAIAGGAAAGAGGLLLLGRRFGFKPSTIARRVPAFVRLKRKQLDLLHLGRFENRVEQASARLGNKGPKFLQPLRRDLKELAYRARLRRFLKHKYGV